MCFRPVEVKLDKKCPECGVQVGGGDVKCPECGAKIPVGAGSSGGTVGAAPSAPKAPAPRPANPIAEA